MPTVIQRSNIQPSKYVYGTTRLGDKNIPFNDRIAIAREAISAGVWIHTSHQYGDALEVLRDAFDEDRANVPQGIFKIGWNSVEEVRSQVLEQIRTLGIESMALGQLCPGEGLANELVKGGQSIVGLNKLKEDGLVRGFVMEVWPWTSKIAIEIIKSGYANGLIEGLIFYLNPLQRFVTNELWDLILMEKIPIIAMRTVSGGNIYRIRDNPSSPDYLKMRAALIAPIFEKSEIKTWTEFSARFSLGIPDVLATVGATSSSSNLQDFLKVMNSPEPLAPDISAEVFALQRFWSHEHDQFAAPWSM